jgi:hypothetical protein
MNEPLPPLSPKVQALLDVEREIPAPPVGLSESLLSSLTLRLTPASAPARAPVASGPGAPWWAAKLGVAALSVAAAVGIGRTVVARLQHRPELRVEHPLPVDSPPPPLMRAPAPAPALPPPPAAAAPHEPAARFVKRAPAVEEDLAAERAQLESARRALLQRDYAAALLAVDSHAARFPRGALAEERESLRIQAMAGAGRRDEAAQLADRFRTRYPASIFGPAVDAALKRAP